MVKTQTKSKQRVADHGEVFTAEREVNAMLDLVKQEAERIDSRFLEPACGNGNFLAEILRRKLATVKSNYGKNTTEYERYAVIAVTGIYGVDLLQDNIEECQNRMFGIFDSEYSNVCRQKANDETRNAVKHILKHNILCGNALTMKTASGTPIEFAEWTAVDDHLIKRRDFRFDQMLENKNPALQLNMFGDNNSGRYELDESGTPTLSPVREFPPVHYREVHQHE